MMERWPSLRSVRVAPTAHQSNSTDEPMRYAPQPSTTVVRCAALDALALAAPLASLPGPRLATRASDSVALYVMYR